MLSILKSKIYWVYASYDFSNSGFVLIFQTFFLPLFFLEVFPDSLNGEFAWAIVVAAYSIGSIILSPIVGAFGDRLGRAILFPTLVFIAGFMTLYAVSSHETIQILIVSFVLAAISFELSQVIYDSFIPELEKPEKRISLSSFSWGIGYLGGAFFAIFFLLFEERIDDITLLQIFALMYLLFSLPAIYFFWICSTKNRHRPNSPEIKRTQSARDRQSWGPSESKNEKKLLQTSPVVGWINLFIIWSILQAAIISFSFASIYMSKYIGMTTQQIGIYVLIMQLLAVVLTPLIGLFAEARPLRVLRFCIAAWVVFLVLLLLLNLEKQTIWLLVFLGAALIGSTQALVRGLFARSVLVTEAGEQFGYFAIAQKGAAVTGPALVTLVLATGGNLLVVFGLLACLIVAAFALSFKMTPWWEET